MKMLTGPALCLAIAALAGCPQNGGGGGTDPEIQGKWVFVIPAGAPVPADFEHTVTFSGTRFATDAASVQLGFAVSAEGTFRVDPEASPKHLDVTITKENGVSLVIPQNELRLYEIDAGRLRIAIMADGGTRARSFETADTVNEYLPEPSKSNTADILDAVISVLGEEE